MNKFICPICDEDSEVGREREVAELFEALEKRGAAKVCTTAWLQGRALSSEGLKRLRLPAGVVVECACFENVPSYFADKDPGEFRFFLYYTIALKLGAHARERVQIPSCVQVKINAMYGQSLVGYKE